MTGRYASPSTKSLSTFSAPVSGLSPGAFGVPVPFLGSTASYYSKRMVTRPMATSLIVKASVDGDGAFISNSFSLMMFGVGGILITVSMRLLYLSHYLGASRSALTHATVLTANVRFPPLLGVPPGGLPYLAQVASHLIDRLSWVPR